ncbi:fructose-bisphosphate aldolase class I [Patescibacteria group bacterium]|nr:fructose-bisphosphate aldolase class I [Patescibacteria group bacterium]
MAENDLESTAKELVAPGKGIWATDASTPTMDKRLTAAGITPTLETRTMFREVLISTPGLGEFISGVILYDETIRQRTSEGIGFVDLLQKQGIVPGIKVDKGTVELEGSPEEKVTEGLEGLSERLAEYKQMGAKFAKWRAVISIGDGIPSQRCIEPNAQRLASYAKFCQEQGLVPIVEPEVLMDGEHTIEKSEEITTAVLLNVFAQLKEQKVALEGIILKPNMVLSGYKCQTQAGLEEVAQMTIRTLLKTVPKEVPGIVFLSGGQDVILATARLNEICKTKDLPWKVSFSFERGLEGPAMEIWKNEVENGKAVQSALYKRAKLNSLASQGQYLEEMENEL